jgi:hypothetical protein
MNNSELQKLLDLYNQGLGLYKEKKFQEAKNLFLKALGVVPGDGPSQLYIERCDYFIKNPPPENWDGVYTMTTK